MEKRRLQREREFQDRVRETNYQLQQLDDEIERLKEEIERCKRQKTDILNSIVPPLESTDPLMRRMMERIHRPQLIEQSSLDMRDLSPPDLSLLTQPDDDVVDDDLL